MNIFTIYSLFYSLLINIVYFSSKRLRSIENKIFEKIMLTNFVGVLLAIGSYFTIKNIDRFELLNTFVSKGYIVYLLTWLTLFSVYIFVISIKDGKDKKSAVNKIINLFGILYLIFLIIIIIKPLYYHNINGAIYSYGPSANVMYIVSIVYITVWLIRLSTNIKRIRDKKYLPIFAFMGLGLVVMIIQKQHPELLLMTSMETFIVFLMYHTIENPDMQIIEEVHRAKEISDNANEEKTMFLYNMTNEIRGITRDINKEADIILDETDNKKIDIEVIDNSAREIKGSTARFTTMTNEILDVSNMDGASIRVYDEKYNIRLILDSLISIYKKKCNSKNISFRSNISSDIPKYLYGDGINLKKILDILLDNSVKYTDNGYVELDVNTITKNDMVRLIINIEDSGIGIDSEKLGSLFVNKKDYKEDNYDLNDTLYNVKKIITMMGGTIIPNSTYGKGTNMKIILDQKLVIDNNKLDEYEKRIDKKDILYVGSDGKLINKLLKGKEVDLEIIELGKEALDKIRGNKKYDLILLEDDIKPLSGLIIMKKLFMIKSFNTKVILLTKNNEYKDSYKEYGFSDVILKPIDEEIFNNIIDKYLK